MINIAQILMYLSIILFFGAAIAAAAAFFNKLVSKPIRLPPINFRLPRLVGEKAVYFEIASYCIISRLLIYVTGILGFMLVKNQAVDLAGSFSALFDKWDGNHYIFIAENWYVNFGDKKNLLVFFPLYPTAVKIVSLITFNYQLAGVLVSNISLIIGCIYLYKITEMEFDSDTGIRAVKYLLLFPVSFFLGITFSESMFFALTVAAFYYLRKKEYIVVGILSFLAALTRSFGVLIILPMVVDLILEFKNNRNIFYKESVKRIGALISPFLGISVYLIINYQVSGNPFTFLKYQKEHWHQTIGFFGSTIKMIAANTFGNNYSESASLWAPQLIIIFLALILLCLSIKRLNIGYVAYMIGYIFLTISPTWLLSAPRYLMCLFPLFILMGYFGRKRGTDFAITVFMALGLGFCTIAFVNGYYIM